MEMGMKEDVDVADEMSLSRSKRNQAQSALKCTYLQFMVLEGKDCDENAHEGGHGCCRQTALLVLESCAQRARTKICSLWWLEVKDCNENRYEGGCGRC